MSADGYYLVAHCVNAVNLDRAEVEWEVAAQSVDGRWYTNDGREIWPFQTQPIDDSLPSIPEGWIEHLHELAAKQFHPPSLTELLGIVAKPKAPSTPIVRRF